LCSLLACSAGRHYATLQGRRPARNNGQGRPSSCLPGEGAVGSHRGREKFWTSQAAIVPAHWARRAVL